MMLRIALLAGAAAGICSALYFVSLTIGAGPIVPLVVSALICAGLIIWFRLPAAPDGKPATGWLRTVFCTVLAAAIVAFVVISAKQPHGFWDAWSIWNLHARFLERDGGAQWTAVFAKQLNWTHPDYPLLTPALVAQIWSVVRSEVTAVPAAVAFLFTFGTAALLIGAIHRLRGWEQALIAGTFLLGGGEFIEQGVVQYADIPLAFYILAALVLLCFDDPKCTVLAGAMAGFAAWTKNEGLVFLVVLVAARSVAQWGFGKTAALARESVLFALGLAPVLAVVALFKFRYAPADELVFAHKSGEILGRAIDFGRYITVTEAFVKAAFGLGAYLVPAILVLAGYAWLVQFKVERQRRTAVATVIATVILMLAGDFFVYVLFPNDVNWQIGTSIDRIFIQVWPAALLGFFTLTSTDAIRRETKKEAKKAVATRRR